MVIFLDRNSGTPLYEQIYVAIREEILSGGLALHERLPATRALAEKLGVSRNTVNFAYQQLALEGYIAPRAGSGYTVEEAGAGPARAKAPARPPVPDWLPPSAAAPRYDLWFPLIDNKLLPGKAWRKAVMDGLSRMESQRVVAYPPHMGEPDLRAALADYLHRARGVSCDPEQIAVSCGMQFNLELLLKQFDPAGRPAAMEEPGYFGARDVFRLNRFSILPVPVEHDGVSTRALRGMRAGLLYLTPSHQFPTGAVLPIRKRMEILEWARQNDAYVIEDDYDSELRYLSMPVPSLQSLDPYGRVIYMGTFSKSLSPALRISYMVLPKQLLAAYRQKGGRLLCQVPLLHQYALTEFIRGGCLERHLNRLRNQYGKRHDAFLAALDRVFGDKVRVLAKRAGVHFLIEVDTALSAQELVRRAAARGIQVYTTEMCWCDPSKTPPHQLLIGYGSIDESEYEPTLRQLRATWAAF